MVTDLKSVSRTELSRATGVDIAHISRICTGKSRPSLPLAVKIAIHLGMTVEDFYQLLTKAKQNSGNQ